MLFEVYHVISGIQVLIYSSVYEQEKNVIFLKEKLNKKRTSYFLQGRRLLKKKGLWLQLKKKTLSKVLKEKK